MLDSEKFCCEIRFKLTNIPTPCLFIKESRVRYLVVVLKFWLLRSEIREFRFSNSIFYSFLVIGRKTGEIEKHVYFDPFLNICVETGTRGKYNNSTIKEIANDCEIWLAHREKIVSPRVAADLGGFLLMISVMNDGKYFSTEIWKTIRGILVLAVPPYHFSSAKLILPVADCRILIFT